MEQGSNAVCSIFYHKTILIELFELFLLAEFTEFSGCRTAETIINDVVPFHAQIAKSQLTGIVSKYQGVKNFALMTHWTVYAR